MYSVVLMTALTAGSVTPDWHHCGYHFGWGGGCSACSGGYYGGGYEGCGCWGGYSSWSYCNMPPPNPGYPGGFGVAMGGATGPTAAPGNGAADEELDKPKTKKKNGKQTMVPTGAKLLIELPANAKLFIDDTPVKAAADVQTFHTPLLEPGRDYFYSVRIELMRDGQPLSQTRQIIVRAGQVARADFKDLESETLRTAQAK
jgi:uncharacterized protein (TIGR03000 family)